MEAVSESMPTIFLFEWYLKEIAMQLRSLRLWGTLIFLIAVLIFPGTAVAQTNEWCTLSKGSASGCAEITLSPAALAGDFHIGDMLIASDQNPGRLNFPLSVQRIDVRNIQSSEGGTLNLTCDIRNTNANDQVACAISINGIPQSEQLAPGAKTTYFLEPGQHVISIMTAGSSSVYWSPAMIEQKTSIAVGQTVTLKPRFDKKAHLILTLDQPNITADIYLNGILFASQVPSADIWVAPNKNHKIEAKNIVDPAANGLYKWRDATTYSYVGAGIERTIKIKLVKQKLPIQGLVCSGGQKYVALLVDPALITGIRTSLSQFERDLCNAKYSVVEYGMGFSTPEDLRYYLIGLNAATNQRLAGSILIGNLPRAYQWVTLTSTNPNIPSSSSEAISYQYYADLDGVFAASPGYGSPGGHPYSFDTHTGDIDWESWVGILPMYKGDYGLTSDAVNRYFAKNHAYRTGDYRLPKVFRQVDEHFTASTMADFDFYNNALRTGQYSWSPWSRETSARVYFNSPITGMTPWDGYNDMMTPTADFTVNDTHGNYARNGLIDISWVESHPIHTTFYWSNGCATGNLDYADNFLSAILYSPTSDILVAKGTSNDSGGMGTNSKGFFGRNIAVAMSQGKTFGEAILYHVNVPLSYPWLLTREFLYATPVTLGDPTLTR